MTARLLSSAALLCGLCAGAVHAQQPAAAPADPHRGPTPTEQNRGLTPTAAPGAAQAPRPAGPSAEQNQGQTPVVVTPVETPATTPIAAAPTVPAAPVQALPRVPVQPMQESAVGSSAGNLVQTIFALLVVLGLLAGLAWFLKRYGPKAAGGSANLRTVGALSLGGRERIIVVEVGDQWIVVGASPGRVNALATMPKQHTAETAALLQPNSPPAGSFSEWLKQTIDKRNAR